MQKNVKYKETEQKPGPYHHFYLRSLKPNFVKDPSEHFVLCPPLQQNQTAY